MLNKIKEKLEKPSKRKIKKGRELIEKIEIYDLLSDTKVSKEILSFEKSLEGKYKNDFIEIIKITKADVIKNEAKNPKNLVNRPNLKDIETLITYLPKKEQKNIEARLKTNWWEGIENLIKIYKFK